MNNENQFSMNKDVPSGMNKEDSSRMNTESPSGMNNVTPSGMNNGVQNTWSKITRSATFKALTIGMLMFMMMIPMMMVTMLIRDREKTGKEVMSDVSSKWGNRQTITGPIVCVPYTYVNVDSNSKHEIETQGLAYFLPEELDMQTDVQPETRYRSIYKVVVYQSKIKVSGFFKHPDFTKLSVKTSAIDWGNAFAIVGISDLRGIRNKIDFNWDGTSKESMSGLGDSQLLASGIFVKIPLKATNDENKTYPFNFSLTLNGSQGLYFVPAGKTTNVTMTSPWNSPSFDGAFLPERRDVTGSEGFTASWSVLSYNRNSPQMWTGLNNQILSSEFGVNLKLPVDHYQKTMRSAKYAIMFIALTFLAFFLVELLSRKQIHPFQYLLVSIGLIVFYCLLLALSENIHFTLAYLISALAIVGLITAYSLSIYKSAKQSVMMGGFLTALYLFLFTLLQLEDLALLFGSIGLFIALAVVMYISRKVDWYHY
jgi:inner membrane protein